MSFFFFYFFKTFVDVLTLRELKLKREDFFEKLVFERGEVLSTFFAPELRLRLLIGFLRRNTGLGYQLILFNC